ncbi:MAG TPA: AmmeMemoRadiSam system radical SAM enzyme [Firmicutes bacterium]|nr:AmmeMemoRadiSam system radical SAM enzyme [Candidatus Fermentithermobacillaceae bacterium]
MDSLPSTEARFYRSQEGGKVACELCPHGCVIPPGKYGICRVRQNLDGKLVSRNYGAVTSLALDPVEKKPLFHVHPGGMLLSVGSFGCNFRCEFCQNWQISQARPYCEVFEPEEIVLCASQRRQADRRVVGIAYTYNEPTVGLEFVLDSARLANEQGLLNVMVTNGFISPKALEEVLPLVGAFNIDVKAWDEDFYRDLAGGRLEPVKKTVERAVRYGAWVEVTCLVIPGQNDRDEDMEGLSGWLGSLSPAIPLHLSRYFPAYKSREQVTPTETLERLREVALRNLHYVYIGNAWKTGYADTRCPKCGELLLERGGMELEASYLDGKACPKCRRPLEIVGEVWAR